MQWYNWIFGFISWILLLFSTVYIHFYISPELYVAIPGERFGAADTAAFFGLFIAAFQVVIWLVGIILWLLEERKLPVNSLNRCFIWCSCYIRLQLIGRDVIARRLCRRGDPERHQRLKAGLLRYARNDGVP